MRIEEPIPPALAGERLDRVVALVADVSRAAAAELVAAGAVTVNGACVRAGKHRLAEDDVVALSVEQHAGPVGPAPDPSVEVVVVHADDDVLVVDKPAGLVVHPGAGRASGTLVQGLLARHPELAEVGEPERPGIVHRLDRETSGLLVVARTPDAYDDLVAQLSARTVERRYEALVWGHLETTVGRIDGPIGRSRRHPTRMTVAADGREAITDYRVLGSFDEPVAVSHLECRLLTGRTHQIRVHLRSIGHPVVGDDQYGGVRQSLPVPRLWLHAETLGFTHPSTGERLVFHAPLPDDLRAVLAGLG